MATARDSGKTLVLLMIDLRRAFDHIDRMQLENVLRMYGYDEVSITLMKQLWNDEIVIKYGDDTFSEAFRTRRSVAQGDVLSSFAFTLCCDIVLRSCIADLRGYEAKDSTGLHELIKALLYSDDIIMFTGSEEDATHNLSLIAAAFRKFGLDINISKTKILIVNADYTTSQDSRLGYAERCHSKVVHIDNHPTASRTVPTTSPRGPR